MPENPNERRRRHPAAAARHPSAEDLVASTHCRDGVRYAELCCRSNFSFLRGASHPEELVDRAADLGYAALAITDRNSLAGVVRMHVAAKARNLRLVVGAEVTPADAPPIVLYPTDRPAYGRLARLLTRGKMRAAKNDCIIKMRDLAELSDGLVAVALGSVTALQLATYKDVFGDRLYLGAASNCGADDAEHLADCHRLARRLGVPMIATNDVHYHAPERRFLQDVMTCVRKHCTLEQAGTKLLANAERYLKSPPQIARLFADYPDAVARTVEVPERCAFSLDDLRYEYPKELCPDGDTPLEYLKRLTWRGTLARYPAGLPDKVRRLIDHELRLIEELGYEPYFLTIWDIVQFARSRNILCQGRGSAANSAVCYCLGITAVDPDRIDLLFERFVSKERNEPPDIDVDFEHERREEVLQYVYNKYGRERAGIVAEVITYRPRSAVRDVGKALGLSLDRVNQISKSLEWWIGEPLPREHLVSVGVDPDEPRIRQLIALVRQLIGFPRHLSQHVGGFVITEGPLCEMVPIGNAAMPDRTFIEWDKDDIDALGILKVDCLALGMLTAVRKCFDLINGQCTTDGALLSLPTVPAEDPAVYDMIRQADTVGVFQIESRAQMSMLPRLKPRCFYDLVIEVAIVRPGPIQGDMVHPYLRRRDGIEAVQYPNDAIRGVLEKTLGVPLFQEQAMSLAAVAAGFTPGEADQLRRAMGGWRRPGVIEEMRDRLIRGMLFNGLSREFAERCFDQIEGFGTYGFPESHAASFALLVYVSAWLKCHYPAVFACALLNSQPMGFYAPAQLVRDAAQHGVEVRPIDVNHSDYDCTLEPPYSSEHARPAAPGRSDAPETWGSGGRALRLGMRLVGGISAARVDGIQRARREGWFASVVDLFRRSAAPRSILARLAAADAFRSMGYDRREALWQVLALDAEKSPQATLFDDVEPCEPPPR